MRYLQKSLIYIYIYIYIYIWNIRNISKYEPYSTFSICDSSRTIKSVTTKPSTPYLDNESSSVLVSLSYKEHFKDGEQILSLWCWTQTDGAGVRVDSSSVCGPWIPLQHTRVQHDSHKPGATQKWVMGDPDRHREREAGAGRLKISIEKTKSLLLVTECILLLELHYKTCCSLHVV